MHVNPCPTVVGLPFSLLNVLPCASGRACHCGVTLGSGSVAKSVFMKTILTLFISVFCLSTSAIAASDDSHWDDQFAPPGADNLVLAITPKGPDLYVGGFFTVIGEAKSPAIAKWDGTN